MSRLFQIHEGDLADLERLLPVLQQHLFAHLTPQSRTALRRCQTILSDVRWNYGPPQDVERIDDPDETERE